MKGGNPSRSNSAVREKPSAASAGGKFAAWAARRAAEREVRLASRRLARANAEAEVGIDADVDPEPIEAILIRRLAAPARPRVQPRVDPAAAAPKSVTPEAAKGVKAEMP